MNQSTSAPTMVFLEGAMFTVHSLPRPVYWPSGYTENVNAAVADPGSGEYMDHGFTKSMKELDRCYTMLQELRSVIVGGELIHKKREGSKHEGYQVCRVPMTTGKFYKVEVLCIVDDIDECHILLERPWRCEVNDKYDVKSNLYLFSWEGRRTAMGPPKVTP
ncbi:hypothetical protein Tco_1251314 [Tanacetum coccineum]